jgi:hypothetical protein
MRQLQGGAVKKTILATAESVSLETIPVRVAFNPLAVEKAKTEALDELDRLQGATIDNDAELAEFSALLVSIVAERKTIENMRDGLRAPLKVALKAVDALFALSLQCKEASERKLRELVGTYQQGKAAEHRRLMAEAATAAQTRKPEALTAALVKASAVVPGKLASVGVKEVWQARLKSPDLKRINRHARETPIDKEPTPIPGVLFERVASTTVRS